MQGKFHSTDLIKPIVNKLGNVAFAADDVLFDWTAFEIPKGACMLHGIAFTLAGTNAAVNNAHDITLYFARSVDGVDPPSLGDSNAAMNVISSIAARPYMFNFIDLDWDKMTDVYDSLVGWNIGATSHETSGPGHNLGILLSGDPKDDTRQGYQTIWVAGVAQGALDFGTDCLVAGEHAADDLTIVVDGTDCDDLFAVGETVVAFANDGSAEKVIGKVTAVAADLLTVDAAPVILPDDHEICLQSPVTLRFNLEY